MLTVRGQQHSFLTRERMYLWKCQGFETKNASTWEGLVPPTFGSMPNALTIGAIRAKHLLSHVFEHIHIHTLLSYSRIAYTQCYTGPLLFHHCVCRCPNDAPTGARLSTGSVLIVNFVVFFVPSFSGASGFRVLFVDHVTSFKICDFRWGLVKSRGTSKVENCSPQLQWCNNSTQINIICFASK